MEDDTMYAKTAGTFITLRCRNTFKTEPDVMASTMCAGQLIDVFDHKGYGTHKYIPAEKLTKDLGEPKESGVYGFWAMADGSYLLLTCRGPLAVWSGKPEDAAEWIQVQVAPHVD